MLQDLADVFNMLSAVIIMTSEYSKPGGLKSCGDIILSSAPISGDDNIGPAGLENVAQHRRLWLDVEAYTNGQTCKRFGFGELLTQQAQQTHVSLGPTYLSPALFDNLLVEDALFGHR